jgi:hypothetical protein
MSSPRLKRPHYASLQVRIPASTLGYRIRSTLIADLINTKKNLRHYLTDLKMVLQMFQLSWQVCVQADQNRHSIDCITQVQRSGKRSYGFKAKLSNDKLVHQTLPVPLHSLTLA